MNEPINQFAFLETFIHQLFDGAGFASTSEATRKQFVPLFTAEAERRLGLALVPLLNEAQAKELSGLLDSGDLNTEAMSAFWRASVPQFNKVVEKTLSDFAVEFKKSLA